MRNKIILLMLLSIITAFSYQESYEVLAHFEDIGVSYDECIPVNYVDENNIGDGINEKWYSLTPNKITSNSKTYHFYNTQYVDVQTIKYYISDVEYVNNIDDVQNNMLWTWETELILALQKGTRNDYSFQEIPSIVNEIKQNYLNSMFKWNNIFIYHTLNDGSIIRKKLINIEEGDSQNYDLIICPLNTSIKTSNPRADTIYIDGGTNIDSFTQYVHKHYNKYRMRINVLDFYNENLNKRDVIYSQTGAHEFGHVLGLDDVKPHVENDEILYTYCHHEELIMGYPKNFTTLHYQTNITYKDIAGAMINMGFHTSSEHKWMYTEDSNIVDPETGNIIINDGYKLICSICNGVKYSPTIPSGSVLYEGCNGNHQLSSGNMMAVASYETKDYYKCKYCRYVAPFELNVEQSYGEREYISGNNTQHYAHSNNGLTYKILENHYSDYESNTYQKYSISDIRYSTKHIVTCGCDGVQMVKMHVFTNEDVNDGNATTTCIDCNAVVTNSGPGIVGPLSNNIRQVTDNGSYKLTNGIIILVEEDIQAFKEGTLVFKDANSEIM